MIEFIRDKDKPVAEKVKLYRTRTIILWVFTIIMYGIGIFLITYGTLRFKNSQSGAEGWAFAFMLLSDIFTAFILIGGGSVVLAFAIIFTISYHHYKPKKSKKHKW